MSIALGKKARRLQIRSREYRDFVHQLCEILWFEDAGHDDILQEVHSLRRALGRPTDEMRSPALQSNA